MVSNWLDTLVSYFASFANTAALWRYNSYSWVWPLSILSPFFVALSSTADNWFWSLWQFAQYFRQLENNLSVVFSWQSIINSFSYVISQVNTLWAWFGNWWGSVSWVINSWWQGTSSQVLGWISSSTQGLSGLLVSWNNFWVNLYPSLLNWSQLGSWWSSRLADVNAVISSAFVARADLWAGWSEFRQRVSDFFDGPWDWLEARFTDWFLGGQ